MAIFELIGNDVCGHTPSLSAMTPPEKFKANILKIWNWLDTTLPKGSHMIVVGLVDGSILYQLLGTATHPIGITYADLYDYLNCLEISPCWGWMNTNATVRAETTKHAQLLNTQYAALIEEHKFKNFDIMYTELPL